MSESDPAWMKEEDIRPEQLTQKLAEYLLRDRERWLAGVQDFVRVPCPACGETAPGDAFTVRDYAFETCGRCKTVFYNPRPSEEQLGRYYREAESYGYWAKFIFPQSEEARRRKIFAPRAAAVKRLWESKALPTGRMLEIGAGYGIFCEEVRKLSIFREITAVEPTPDLAGVCRNKGFRTLAVPYEGLQEEPGSYSLVAAWEVIEHLFSPAKFIVSMRALLEPGGVLLLSCPNIEGFDMMVLGCALADNFGLEHINMFNPPSLTLLLERHGFGILELTTPGQLDAELVRKKILAGKFSVDDNPFLKRVLIDDWERVGESFQRFLSENGMSSHMVVMAQKA